MTLPPAAATLAGAFVVLFGLVILGGFVRGDTELVRQLASGLLNIVIAVAAFYFGSSQGSQAKDATIARALNPDVEVKP